MLEGALDWELLLITVVLNSVIFLDLLSRKILQGDHLLGKWISWSRVHLNLSLTLVVSILDLMISLYRISQICNSRNEPSKLCDSEFGEAAIFQNDRWFSVDLGQGVTSSQHTYSAKALFESFVWNMSTVLRERQYIQVSSLVGD